MQAYVLIKANIGDIYPALGILRRTRGVISAEAVFGPHDIVALIEAEKLAELDNLVNRQIASMAEITDTTSCILQNM